MKFFPQCVPVGVLLFLSAIPVAWCAGANSFNLQQAESLVLQQDPLIARARAAKTVLAERAVAVDTLPDPKLNFGIVNLPVDSFEYDVEPMTQGVLGISQAFPAWGSLSARHKQFNELASAANAAIEDETLKVLRSLRVSWLLVYYQFHARELVQQSLEEFEQFIKITRVQYRAGRGKQQDVIRAQLEQSLLQDREKSLEAQWESARAQLVKWIGNAAEGRELDMAFPDLPDLPQPVQLTLALEQHPALKAGKSRIKASENEVDFADAQYNPGWKVDVRYGYRAAGRDDFISAMISMDMPFFTGKRQDKQLAASKASLSVTKNNLDELRREYQRRLDDARAVYQRMGERIELYRAEVLPESQQNTEATLNAYQSGVTDFNDVVRARLTQLDSQLNFLKLQVDQARAQTDLLYLAGG
jgi:outer membrane protein TolC